MTEKRQPIEGAAVLSILSHLSSNMRDDKLSSQPAVAGNPMEARELLSQLVEHYGDAIIPADQVLSDASSPLAAAYETLELYADEPDTRALARELLDAPPDGQKSVEVAMGAAIVLGSLVTWLQTKVDIEISRGESGKVTFRFALKKNETNARLLHTLASTISQLISTR